MTKALIASGNDIAINSPEAFAKIVKDDVERWGTVIRDAGVQAN